MATKRYKLPEKPQYRKQVKTFVQRHGRGHYSSIRKKIGATPASFNSETGRKAALRSWEVRRARAAEKAAERIHNNNGKSEEGDESLEEK